MARRKVQHEPENHDRWLVSYADFITLLFAFFVVMYSISSVNEGQYRVLSDSMTAAFKSPTRSLDPIQIGNLVRSPALRVNSIMDVPRAIPYTPIVIDPVIAAAPIRVDETSLDADIAAQQIGQIADEVESTLDELIAEEDVSVRRNRLWVEIEMNSNLLFTSASATLSNNAAGILGRLSEVLASHENRIHVEGFTDNRPINNPTFPSNWELSGARAAAVVRLFESEGVGSDRMTAVGYGEHRPLSSNDTEEGRGDNRRVVVVVLAQMDGSDETSFAEYELLRQSSELN